jgi:hypothetical protein
VSSLALVSLLGLMHPARNRRREGKNADHAWTGWYGLAAAKQYHCTQPGRRLAVLDSESSLGGTWADHRLYPGLKSNNLLGTYEFPDFPMDTETFGVKTNEHIPAPVINRYLKAYAAKFGITEFVRLQTKVSVAEHQDCDQCEAGREQAVHAKADSGHWPHFRPLLAALCWPGGFRG